MGDSIDGSSNAAQRARSMTPDPAAPHPAMRLVETEGPVSRVAGSAAAPSVTGAADAVASGSLVNGSREASPAMTGTDGIPLAHAKDGLRLASSSEGGNGPARPNGATPAAPQAPSAPSRVAPVGAPANANPRRRPGFFGRLLGNRGSAATRTPESSASAQPASPPQRRHSLLNLRNMRVEDVAIPKVEIVAVPKSISQDDLVGIFRESGMTRLPVYDETLDSPKGFVHLKDFALKHGWDAASDFQLEELLRPLLFVPPSMPIGVLLQKMQTERRHMALVIDEYGGVDGLVTIEDLIEQVIGEIEDEHDVDEDALWTREASGSYLALAKAPLEDFEVATGLSLTDDDSVDEEEIDTLGGLVFMLAGRVPARGEVVVHPAGHEFEVVEADPRRIKRLRVRLKPADAE
ncbi:Hemolysin C [Pseudooceanicola marinus]|uniref:Hemolysin C n=2 Tax=Pseudooceanicola marinus TaxID=396013 RepID=A0A1X6ZYD0_9RHOB|nr:Hemolysin C [Pseudooceanicola marinus]